MRNFIRHPTDFPIELSSPDHDVTAAERTKNVSAGGLCCHSGRPMEVGARVSVRIPVGPRPFESEGTVAWCAETDNGYDVGIRFAGGEVSFGLRMVEQVCRIQRYREQIREQQGRELSEDQAAREWIAQFASSFPE